MAQNSILNAFHSTFASQYQTPIEDRWEKSLFPALCKPTRHVSIINRFVDPKFVAKVLSSHKSTYQQLPFSNLPCLYVAEDKSTSAQGHHFPKPQYDPASGCKTHYCLGKLIRLFIS